MDSNPRPIGQPARLWWQWRIRSAFSSAYTASGPTL